MYLTYKPNIKELARLTWVFSRSFFRWHRKASAKNSSKLSKFLHSEVNLLIQHIIVQDQDGQNNDKYKRTNNVYIYNNHCTCFLVDMRTHRYNSESVYRSRQETINVFYFFEVICIKE